MHAEEKVHARFKKSIIETSSGLVACMWLFHKQPWGELSYGSLTLQGKYSKMRFQLLSRTEILQKLFSDSSMDGGMRTSSSSPGGSVSSHESDFKSIVTTTDEPSSVRGSSPIRNSCEIFNLTSPWNCRYVYQPCSARGITNSLRFLH